MTPANLNAMIRNLDKRTSSIEQILPTLATKADLERFATKDDLRNAVRGLATKEDLERFATKVDLDRYATKADLERFATKEDSERFPTKEDVADSRRYALVLHEDVKSDLRLLAEHLASVMAAVHRLEQRA